MSQSKVIFTPEPYDVPAAEMKVGDYGVVTTHKTYPELNNTIIVCAWDTDGIVVISLQDPSYTFDYKNKNSSAKDVFRVKILPKGAKIEVVV